MRIGRLVASDTAGEFGCAWTSDGGLNQADRLALGRGGEAPQRLFLQLHRRRCIDDRDR
jgi:hypothetical protein